MSDDDLRLLLVESEDVALYSPSGRARRGRQLFNAKLQTVRKEICEIYAKVRDDTAEYVDIACALTIGLLDNPAFDKVPVAAFSVLATRHGLDKLCSGDDDARP
ncbi:hypothetical protein [Actinomycetospora sp. NBRC 106375]|uniref:hypothetical protein n=1 Tax=Actinomycetospora sp. NBRC 106375 TaxID=3032207 RepID=UPI002555BB9E|nr:hypothetical protein [Actinomycetospora sp. NBRC 106375]